MARHRILRYMTRFRCTGPECEATCCAQGWSIPVDEEHFLKLEEAMSHDDADRQRFREAVRRAPEAKSEHGYGLIVLDERGACRLLDPEGSCSVHRRFGESVLPNTCAIFPRKLSIAHRHLEVAGLLSCPEVTRQLYAGDDSTTVDRLDARTVRHRVTQLVDHESRDPYDLYVDDVRATVVGLFEAPYPLASRLFFVGWFAELTRAAFHRGAGEDATDALTAAVDAASDEENLETWHRTFEGLEVTTPLAYQVIAGALKNRVEDTIPYEPFRQLVRDCLVNAGLDPDDETMNVSAAEIAAAYRARREGRDSDRVQRMLTSYAIDYWLKDYYTESKDLAVHADKLVLRLALLRFLLFTHPALDDADPAPALVDVTYKLARAVEHEPNFAENLDTLMARLGIASLAHSMFLMKV